MTTKPPPELTGHVLTTTTPFDDDYRIDLNAFVDNIEYLLAMPGCGGIYLGSVYQEFWTLSLAERLELTHVVIDTVGHRVPVIAGVSGSSIRDTIDLIEGAQTFGADYLMLWPPTFGPRADQGVLSFYRLALQETALPTFLYSTRLKELGYYLGDANIQILADEFEHVYGVKDGTGDVTEFLRRTDSFGDRLKVGTPFEEYWALARSAYPGKVADFILGSSRACYMQTHDRPYLHDMVTALRAGRFEDAFQSLTHVRGMIRLQTESFARGVHPIALMKYAMSFNGHRGVSVRPPTPELSLGERKSVQLMMQQAGLMPDVHGAGQAAF